MIGLSPMEIDRMSLWQFSAVVDGWNRAQGQKTSQPMSDDAFDDLASFIDAVPEVVH